MNPFDEARELIQAQISQLQGMLASVAWYESHEVPIDGMLAGLRSGKVEQSEKVAGGHRKAANPNETWADAIDKVLTESTKGLSVGEIVKELERRGRIFPGRRKDGTVAATLKSNGQKYGWKGRGSHPRKWRKPKERLYSKDVLAALARLNQPGGLKVVQS